MNVNKRLLKELNKLYVEQTQKPFLENDYLIQFNEEDMSQVHAIIKCPFDSVYRHKFVRLDLKIPDRYPYEPPQVTFVNYDGVRIHPNMYENGKCCATILNTWGNSELEKWTPSMGIETVLLTFHSFFDNNPYTYEPGGHDDPSYSVYVTFQSWTTCLIRYLQHETIDLFSQFIQNYLLANIDQVFTDLFHQNATYSIGYYNTRCFEIDNYYINYERIISTIQYYYNFISYADIVNEVSFDEFLQKDYKCNICFDTLDNNEYTTTKCNHVFHKSCLETHLMTVHKLCPMCRHDLSWIINPQTRRKIKVGGKTYLQLKDIGII